MVKKTTTPPLNLKLPNVMACDNPHCNNGKVEGAIYKQMVCYKCEGAGVLDSRTGEALPSDVLIPALMREIQLLKNELAQLRFENGQLRGGEKCDRYPENMKTQYNGKLRLD